MNSKISDKDKKDWENFISSQEKLNDKDYKLDLKTSQKIRSIDLHGFTLLEANKIQKKVASVGFEYKSDLESIEKIEEEIKELKIEIKNKNKKKIKEELGDLIFATLDVSRKLELDPEIILKNANRKFSKRWKKVEKIAIKENLNLRKISLKQYNKIWNKAKKN